MVAFEDTRYDVMEEMGTVELCVATTSSEPSPRSFTLSTFTFNSGAGKYKVHIYVLKMKTNFLPFISVIQ